ncbi:MAG: phosphatase PAP2 family protein [Pirellulales bacterium]
MKRRSLQLERLELRSMMASDLVMDWNDEALAAIRQASTAPPVASRGLAMLHIAMFDALSAIDRQYEPFAIKATASPTTSREAAMATAAHTILVSLFPTRQAQFDTHLQNDLALIVDGKAETDGKALGKNVADQIIALRSTDGASTPVAYTPQTGPGAWQPTPPANAAALLPQWANLKPFAMTSASQFSPDDIPALTSTEYAAAFDEVKSLGSSTSTTRTEDQTRIALFWANGAGTATPPGHLNLIAQTVSEQKGISLADNARLFAMLNVAMADAAIMAWNTKYDTEFWRPITAIRAADTDGNAATVADTSWAPLITTPPFPSYVSGHASFSGAAAAVLKSFFGTDNISFVAASENAAVPARSFTSFSQAAQESADSRLYGGIHWRFDNEDGLTAGTALGQFVTTKFRLATSPSSVTAQLIGTDLVVYGTDAADSITVTSTRRDIIVWNRGRKIGTFAASALTSIVIDGKAGNDFLQMGGDIRIAATLIGGSGNDHLMGGRGNDTLLGGEGKDRLFGFLGNDRLDGGDGDDWLFGGNGDDHLIGGAGQDQLCGDGGRDTLEGGEGNDLLCGGAGLDLLDGGTGRNKLRQT